MDNRLRFLYCDATELWGHITRGRPGAESPGKDMENSRRKNRGMKGHVETTEIK